MLYFVAGSDSSYRHAIAVPNPAIHYHIPGPALFLF
jgi:hypothetical protein